MKTVQLRRLTESACDGPFGSAIKTDHYAQTGARVVRLGNIGGAEWNERDEAFIDLTYFDQLKRHEVLGGDLLIAGLGDDRNPVGRASVAPQGISPAIVKADCYRFRLRDSDARFFAYYLSSEAGIAQSAQLADGSTRKRLTLGKALALRVPHLPLAEQRAIADYLDTETARIDALITKKQQLIHLLEERRTGLSFDMIRGSSEPGDRRESGISWIGTIPESWSTPYVASRYELLLGRMLNAARSSGGDQRPYLRNVNVRWNRIDLSDVATMDFPADERRLYRLKAGDLMVCEGGAGYARAYVWDAQVDEMYFQKSLHRLRPRGEWPVEWVAEWLRAGKHAGVFESEGNLATIPHLTAEQLRAHRIPMPPDPSTMRTRLEELKRQARALDRAGEVATDQVNLLADRRSAVISAFVQGLQRP